VKKIIFPVLFGIFLVFPVSAATVSFLVIETGLSDETGDRQHSGLWESGLLDVFFEAGHIVSNAPIMRLDSKPPEKFPEEAIFELENALEGGVEYFIIALLEYPEKGELKPRNVVLRIFRSTTLEMIYEGQYADNRPRTIREDFDSLKRAARGLVSYIK